MARCAARWKHGTGKITIRLGASNGVPDSVPPVDGELVQGLMPWPCLVFERRKLVTRRQGAGSRSCLKLAVRESGALCRKRTTFRSSSVRR